MNKNILNYIEECEAWKVGIKNLHWSADNMSQHELCDDIADEISNFEDLVSEVEQSISGKIKLNGFTPKSYKITSLKSFVEDVISASQSFLKELEGMGEKYVGIKSECETFIGTMQRKLYLVNFTLKEELKKRLRDKINESRPKNLANTEDVEKFMGRRPKTIKARINQIYRIVKKYGIDSRKYNDESWQAIDDYYRAITSLGCEVELKPCGHLNNADSMESDGGYCDYDPYDHMPRSKQYAIRIMFEDGMTIDGYIKCMAAGTVSDPFASYDTCMVLWPKQNNVLENKNMSKQMRLTEAELKQVVKEAAIKILSETPLNYDVDNFSGRWNKNMPDDYIDGESEGYFDDPNRKGDIEYDLDDYASEEGDTRPMKDIENDYSWGLYDSQPIAQSPESEYAMSTKASIPFDVDKAISMRNRGNGWTDRELRHGGRVMDKYVHGKYDGEDVGDAWDDLHYESKKPMKTINEIGDTPKGRKMLARLGGKRMAQGATLGSELKRNGIEGGDVMVANRFNRSLNAGRYAEDALDREIRKALDKFALGEEDEEKIKSIIKNSENKRMQNEYQDEFYGYGENAYRTNESKSLKLSESELKTVVKEAAISLIQEYTQKQANTKGFIKSTYGHRSQPKRKQKQAKGSFGEREKKLLKQMGKEVDESIDIDPKNKGKFTATKKATGKSTEELTHSKNPLTKKRAIFAQNAKKWSKG